MWYNKINNKRGIKMKKILTSILILITISFLTSCHRIIDADIYTSIYPIQFMTEQIVKDNMVVKNVYPNGAEIHDYEPSPAQIINMTKSKAIIYIGAGLEAFIEVAEGTTFKKDMLLELSNYITLIEPTNFTEQSGDHNHPVDPHVWLDPVRMIQMAEQILKRVCLIMPEKQGEFKENADQLIAKLEKLHSDYQNMLNNEDITYKKIVVDHDAYLYWQDRYGIERINARLDNDTCTIIANDYIANIEEIKRCGIKYITTTANESVCNIIDKYKKEANLQEATLHNLETISKEDFDKNKDYFSIMYENLAVLKKILPRKI
jgi:zinc transport system substrate-binding protein